MTIQVDSPPNTPPVRTSVQTTDGTTLEGTALNSSSYELQIRSADQRIHLLRKSGERYRPVTSQLDWPTYHGSMTGNRYSTAAQINRTSVRALGPRWIFTIPNVSRLEVTPIVIGGIMYITAANECRALDAGTGSGILAIAAARIFRARVIATDIDARAIEAARGNARVNRAAAQVAFARASGTTARAITSAAPYQLIFANILLGTLTRLAVPLRKLTAPGAWIVLSGLLPAHANTALAVYRAQGLALESRIANHSGLGLWRGLRHGLFDRRRRCRLLGLPCAAAGTDGNDREKWESAMHGRMLPTPLSSCIFAVTNRELGRVLHIHPVMSR